MKKKTIKKKKPEVATCINSSNPYGWYEDYEEDITFVDETWFIILCALSLVLLPIYIWILVFVFIYNLIRGED